MDVEVIKPFDDLLDSDIMLAVEEDDSEGIEAGCFGAEKEHPYIKKCLNYYKNRKFKKSFVLPFLMRCIKDKYFNKLDYKIHTSDYFTAKSFITGLINKTENTYAIHHYAGSWIPDKDKAETRDKWAFFEKYGGNKFLVDFFYNMENNPHKIPLKELYQIVIKRTIKKLLGKKLMRLTKNIRLKIQHGI
jgi:hypothetical protein